MLRPCKKYLSSGPKGKLSQALNMHKSDKAFTGGGGGHYISCVFDIAFGLDNDKLDSEQNSVISQQPPTLKPACSQFLADIESIVFSDYR